jgi:hypothetical protein
MGFGKCNGGGRRTAARAAVPLTAVITTRFRSQGVTLVDVSRTGARLSGRNLPEQDEELILSMETVRAFATVAWAREGDCGVTFDPALDDDDLRELQRKFALARGLTPNVKAALDDWTAGMAR